MVPSAAPREYLVLALLRFRVGADEAGAFRDDATAALRLLAARPGFVRGQLATATDDPGLWVLATDWEGVGAYRRALASVEVRAGATPLLARVLDEPGGYEPVVTVEGPG
jgi:hypothetical protein